MRIEYSDHNYELRAIDKNNNMFAILVPKPIEGYTLILEGTPFPLDRERAAALHTMLQKMLEADTRKQPSHIIL